MSIAERRVEESSTACGTAANEREVGGALLERTTRRVALTPAGEALYEDATELLAAADGALDRARALARGEAGSLTIGTVGPAPGGVLAPLLARFSGRHPNLRVEVRAFDFSDVVEGVRSRAADCAFVYAPLEVPDLVVTPLMTEPRVVVLPRSHRLARRKRLRPADLVGETFVAHPESVPQAWRDHWLLVEENGSRPTVSPHIADKHEDWLLLIGRGEAIDTAPAVVARYYSWPEVVYVPLVEAAPATIALVHRARDDDPRVLELIELAVEIAARAIVSGTPYSAAPAG